MVKGSTRSIISRRRPAFAIASIIRIFTADRRIPLIDKGIDLVVKSSPAIFSKTALHYESMDYTPRACHHSNFGKRCKF